MKTKKITKKKNKEKGKISGKTTFMDLMEKNPEAANILFESGLYCIGCGMAMYETLEQGCKAHGMNKKQIDALIKRLNEED